MFSKILSVYLIVYLFSNFSHGQIIKTSFREDYTYIGAAESFYKFHTTPKDWRDAKQACDLEAASLFYPVNYDEADAVITFWKRYQNNTPVDNTWVFIGISDIVTEGVYETIDGKPMSRVYNKWKENQPDNSGDEDCLHLNQEGDINDIKCGAQYNFFCKKSLLSLDRDIQKSKKTKKFFRKDYTYVEAVQSFYKIHATPRSWVDAKRVCALEAATFFYPENEDEANEVLSFWKENKPTASHVWIGLTDSFVEGVFETSDGKPISEVYTNWWNGEPNDAFGHEDCVTFELPNKGMMNDDTCEVKKHFMCKKSLKTLQWNSNCNMPNLDYTLSKDTGKCYNVHTTPLTWSEAYSVCQLEQSALAMISTSREADYLAKLIGSTPTPRVKGKYQRGIYHLGFHNKLKEGWQTVKGTPLKVDIETWYDSYQPEGNEECGSMFYTGLLINTDCEMKSFFICEHDVDS